MSAPPGPKTMEAMRKLPSMQELAKNRPDVPTEKPKVQKTVEELEQARSELELACQSFAGKDGKGGEIFELTELLKTDEKEEADLIELLGANADLEQELEPARKAREEDRKQIEHLKQAYDSLLVEIAALNKQIREAREAQVKEGKQEVEKEAAEVEDLTEHAVLEPPPIPFAARDASIAKHQADLAAAPDLTEHAVLQPPPIPEEVRKASREAIPDLSEYVVAMDPPPISEEIRTKSVEQHQKRMMKQAPEKAPAEAAPVKPEPAAKNEAGPETVAEAQAFLAEDQREQLEVRQRLLKLYQAYKDVVLPQTQALSEAAQALGDLRDEEYAGPFASLRLGAKMQLDDTKTLLPLFVGLQSEAMKNTPQDIEARTRDIQMVTARLQMRMMGIQGFRNTLLGLRADVPKGSAREGALVSLDGVAGKAWKALGGMAAEWQPIGAKVQARNGRDYHRRYKEAYTVITSERAKGSDIKIEVPKDVQEAMPKEVVPDGEDLTATKGEGIPLDLGKIAAEIASQAQRDTERKKEIISESAFEDATETLETLKKNEGIRVETTEDIMRRTRRCLADLDFAKGPEAQQMREALELVIRDGDPVLSASEQTVDELAHGYSVVKIVQQNFVQALEAAGMAARQFETSLPEDVARSIQRLPMFIEDLPKLADQDEIEEATRIVKKFESQKKRAEPIPRMSI